MKKLSGKSRMLNLQCDFIIWPRALNSQIKSSYSNITAKWINES